MACNALGRAENVSLRPLISGLDPQDFVKDIAKFGSIADALSHNALLPRSYGCMVGNSSGRRLRKRER
jgi:hypothetical protein